ncbi:hypothetical protein ACIQUL_29615 [Streptomyces sp. NPDC090303]|uniref:hypothetical protein n=1 Tax=Streptomyces sp. NPDC090303 TaxID=3365960 RepID=UPI0037FDEEBB
MHNEEAQANWEQMFREWWEAHCAAEFPALAEQWSAALDDFLSRNPSSLSLDDISSHMAMSLVRQPAWSKELPEAWGEELRSFAAHALYAFVELPFAQDMTRGIYGLAQAMSRGEDERDLALRRQYLDNEAIAFLDYLFAAMLQSAFAYRLQKHAESQRDDDRRAMRRFLRDLPEHNAVRLDSVRVEACRIALFTHGEDLLLFLGWGDSLDRLPDSTPVVALGQLAPDTGEGPVTVLGLDPSFESAARARLLDSLRLRGRRRKIVFAAAPAPQAEERKPTKSAPSEANDAGSTASSYAYFDTTQRWDEISPEQAEAVMEQMPPRETVNRDEERRKSFLKRLGPLNKQRLSGLRPGMSVQAVVFGDGRHRYVHMGGDPAIQDLFQDLSTVWVHARSASSRKAGIVVERSSDQADTDVVLKQALSRAGLKADFRSGIAYESPKEMWEKGRGGATWNAFVDYAVAGGGGAALAETVRGLIEISRPDADKEELYRRYVKPNRRSATELGWGGAAEDRATDSRVIEYSGHMRGLRRQARKAGSAPLMLEMHLNLVWNVSQHLLGQISEREWKEFLRTLR